MRVTPLTLTDRTTLEHALRGLGPLPHVGAHPGVPFAVVMILTGVVAGAQGAGWSGALLGLSAQVLWVLPVLLVGSVDRSRLSDRLERKRAVSSTG